MNALLRRPFLLLLLMQCAVIIILESGNALPGLYSFWGITGIVSFLLLFGILSIQTRKLVFVGLTLALLLIVNHYTHQFLCHNRNKIIPENKRITIDLIVEKSEIRSQANYIYCTIRESNDRIKLKLHNRLATDLYFGDKIKAEITISKHKSSFYWESYHESTILDHKHIDYLGTLYCYERIEYSPNQWNVYRISQVMQHRLLKSIKQKIEDTTCRSLMNGLLLGIQSDLDPDLKKSFQTTGTAHILAVSGLHVGLLYQMASLLLRSIRMTNTSIKRSKSILILMVIWIFAFITGLQSSIIRACVMFSLLEVGNQFYKRNDNSNQLFACASIMLLWNPCTLFDIGFQLSFAAMLSIIQFQPLLHLQFRSGSPVLNSLYQMTSLSLAVQICISPLSMYYFHQFPLSFLLSNLIWIPLSFLLIIVGICILLTFGFVAKLFAIIAKLSCGLGMLWFDLLEKMPFHYLDGLFLYTPQVIAMYTSLGLFWMYYLYGRKIMYFLGIISLVILVSIYPIYSKIFSTQKELIFYSSRTNNIAELRLGLQVITYNELSLPFKQLAEYRQFHMVHKAYTINENEFHAYLQCHTNDFRYILFSNSRKDSIPSPTKTIFWINNPEQTQELICQAAFPYTIVIVSAMLSKIDRKMIRDFGVRNNIHIYDLADQGTLILPL